MQATASDNHAHSLITCSWCGLAQAIPEVASNMRASCARCGVTLRTGSTLKDNSRAAAIAFAALIIYPVAITLPILRSEQMGYTKDTSVLGGTQALLADGDFIIGGVVFLCSIVFPLFKLLGLLVLSGGGWFLRQRHRALTYRLIHWTGRWGMLDVLVVAVVVAAVKLGSSMEVTTGPGAFAFTTCVVLSLIATGLFDPHRMWEQEA